MSTYIFEMNLATFNKFLKTGAISVTAAMEKWMSKIKPSDEIYVYNKDERRVYGIFRTATYIPKKYYKTSGNTQNHHLLSLYSNRITSAPTDENFQSGPIGQRKIFRLEFVRNDAVSQVSDYKTLTGNPELDGMIWGAGTLDERKIVRLPLLNLPASIAEHYIGLIKSSKVEHKIYKDRTRVNLYHLELPPQFELNKGSLKKVQNQKFMEAYLISKIRGADIMNHCTGDIPLEYTFRWTINIDKENVGLKKYLEESGIIIIEDRKYASYSISPLSFNKHPISYLIGQFRKDLIQFEEADYASGEAIRREGDITLEIKHRIISDLFVKLFEYHGYSTHSEVSERLTILSLFFDGKIIKLAIMDKRYLSHPNGFTGEGSERIIIYSESTIESASYNDAFLPNGRSLFENISNDIILNLNRDFSSIFFTYIANIMRLF